MNAVVFAVLACVAVASCTVVAPVQQYYVPTTHSNAYYVQQPSVSAYNYKYVQQPIVSTSAVSSGVQYSVPSTQQYVYSHVPSTYYTSPVASSYGYAAYSPSYSYPSYVYGYGKK